MNDFKVVCVSSGGGEGKTLYFGSEMDCKEYVARNGYYHIDENDFEWNVEVRDNLGADYDR